jgi:hypothetical protein
VTAAFEVKAFIFVQATATVRDPLAPQMHGSARVELNNPASLKKPGLSRLAPAWRLAQIDPERGLGDDFVGQEGVCGVEPAAAGVAEQAL